MVANTYFSFGLIRDRSCGASPRDFRKVMTAARPNSGIDRATRDQRSPSQGRSPKPATRGPSIEPSTLTAYAFPARPGSPADQESTNSGVKKPAYAQKSTMTERRRPPSSAPPSLSGSKGSAAASGNTENNASKIHAGAL